MLHSDEKRNPKTNYTNFCSAYVSIYYFRVASLTLHTEWIAWRERVNIIIKYQITTWIVLVILHFIRRSFALSLRSTQLNSTQLTSASAYRSHRTANALLLYHAILFWWQTLSRAEPDHWSMCSIPLLLLFRLNRARFKCVCGRSISLSLPLLLSSFIHTHTHTGPLCALYLEFHYSI